MTIEKYGFLSEQLDKWIAENNEKNKKFFDLANLANTQCMEIMLNETNASDTKSVVAAAIFARAVQSFQGVILLQQRGMEADARTLVRSCAESAIAIGCAVLDKDFLNILTDGHRRYKWEVASSMSASARSTQDDSLDKAALEEIKEFASEFDAKGAPKYPNWWRLAKKAEFMDLYKMVYADASQDGVHVSLESIRRHIELDENGVVKSVLFGPSDVDLKRTMICGLSAILHCVMAYGRLIASVETEGKAIQLFVQLNSLIASDG
ncbi:hypothetical protein D3C87_168760 [compost metagenome]